MILNYKFTISSQKNSYNLNLLTCCISHHWKEEYCIFLFLKDPEAGLNRSPPPPVYGGTNESEPPPPSYADTAKGKSYTSWTNLMNLLAFCIPEQAKNAFCFLARTGSKYLCWRQKPAGFMLIVLNIRRKECMHFVGFQPWIFCEETKYCNIYFKLDTILLKLNRDSQFLLKYPFLLGCTSIH